jgi:uncharacterized membrane protein YraQ (UPF0718 family)
MRRGGPCRREATESPVSLAGRAHRARIVAGLGFAALAWTALYLAVRPLAAWLGLTVLRLPPGSPAASAAEFFLYETPKVLLLLVLIVFVMGVVRTYFTPERTRAILSGRGEFAGNVLAALLGVVTPFCSCSAVPLFIGFVTAGVPLGVTFSFLVSAPLINEVALVLLFGMFGWKVAGLYMGTGLAIAIVAGRIIGLMRLEKWVEPWVYSTRAGGNRSAGPLRFAERVSAGRTAVRDIVGAAWPFVVAGIAVGSVIHGWVPENALASFMGRGVWWAVPAAVAVGIPLYSNAAGMIPVVQALLAKGAALGTVLAFMMAVIGLSFPELVILRKVLKPRLLAVFVGIVGTGIVLVGYLFNAVLAGGVG